MAKDAAAQEMRALADIARSLASHAPFAADEMTQWGTGADAEAAAADGRACEAAATELRRLWLRLSHDAAHAHFRSPCSDDATHLPSGAPVEFGYERELDPQRLEARAARFAPAPDGWTGRHLLLSSGQAALSAVLTAASADLDGRPLRVAHCGGYFETVELLRLTGAKIVATEVGDAGTAEADLAILEPVYLRERFACLDPVRLAASFRTHGYPRLVLIDATLSHSRFPPSALTAALPRDADCTVMRMSSLLKLDQAGLELAAAGLLSVFGHGPAAETMAERLGKIRATVGAGLAFADMCALDVPFVFDAAFARRYSDAVFAHNARLALALREESAFEAVHPALDCDGSPWAVAPYVVLRPKEGGADACRALAEELAATAEAAGIALRQGGSFGFRTHRFDVVEPEGEPAFLRVAMGASDVCLEDAITLVARAARAVRRPAGTRAASGN